MIGAAIVLFCVLYIYAVRLLYKQKRIHLYDSIFNDDNVVSSEDDYLCLTLDIYAQ